MRNCFARITPAKFKIYRRIQFWKSFRLRIPRVRLFPYPVFQTVGAYRCVDWFLCVTPVSQGEEFLQPGS